ncbi:MAG: hypothetical protein P4L52_05160 [Acidocella sp.]|nr:hypothetical protein [Acidocella sp.]
MPNKNQAGATGVQPMVPPVHHMAHGGQSTPPMPEVAAAMARLRADVDKIKPDHLDETYALLAETHRAIVDNWRGRPQCQEMLEALRHELIVLVDEYHDCAERVLPVNGYMLGVAEDAIRYDTQADVMLDEVRQLEAEAAVLSNRWH